jgi:uridine kinase
MLIIGIAGGTGSGKLPWFIIMNELPDTEVGIITGFLL